MLLFFCGVVAGVILCCVLSRWRQKNNRAGSPPRQHCAKSFSRAVQQTILDHTGKTNNTYGRHSCKSALELDELDRLPPSTKKFLSRDPIQCYGCGGPTVKFHGCYLFSCVTCGSKFQKYRHLSRDLTGCTALVTGGRTKLGHQIVLKLLRAGCAVVATTRHPDKALEMYRQYPDHDQFRLTMYALDLDVPDLKEKFRELARFVAARFDQLDILVNCAAQTIRCREKLMPMEGKDCGLDGQNRYGDAVSVPETFKNSWSMTLEDLPQQEMEEVYRINAVAPVLLIQACLQLLQRSTRPYVINVHAREGIFDGFKTHKHMHTNMAKAALGMATRTLCADRRLGIRVHGCDPGWISVDEYYEDGAPWIVPPLDERDGAARILYPIWRQYNSCWKTRKHYDIMVY